MGWFSDKVGGFYKKLADPLGLHIGAAGPPRAGRFPRFPNFDPVEAQRRAILAAEHERAMRVSAYSLNDFILAGGKPAALKNTLGG